MELPQHRSMDKVCQPIANVRPGKYHVSLQAFEEYGGRNGMHKAVFEIKGAAVASADCIGATHTEGFFSEGRDDRDDTWSDVLTNLAIALGAISLDDVRAANAGGVPLVVDLTEATGRQCLVELVSRKYTTSDGTEKEVPNIGDNRYAVYAFNDPRAKGFPVNAAAKKFHDQIAGQDSAVNDLNNLV